METPKVLEVLGLAGALLAVIGFALLAAVYATPRHEAGCSDPKCTGCSRGPR